MPRLASARQPFGQRLYGLLHDKLHLPWVHSVRFVRWIKTVKSPVEYLQRKHAASKLQKQASPFAGRVADGYWLFGRDELPGSRAAASACARMFDDMMKKEGSDGATGKNKKKHLRAVLSGQDFEGCPEVLEFALSKPVIDVAASYFRSAPVLSSICLFWSVKNDTNISSQQFHIDGEDLTQLKLFLNVWDVDDETGPLTFLSARSTSEVLRHASKEIRLNAGESRFDDELVDSASRTQAPIAVKGPAGAGVFLDTSRCLHFGSRGNTKERLVLMIKYAPYNLARESATAIRSTDWIKLRDADDLQRLALKIPA
jgi:hypothetical protein